MIDFLCIGAQKAGTTWLIANIKKHPKIWTPIFAKELHYFDAVHFRKQKNSFLNGYKYRVDKIKDRYPRLKPYFEKILDRDFALTDDWYRHIFSISPQGSVKGECTPLYSSMPIQGIEHIHSLMPATRLIYMIRDPFDRLLSSYRMQMDRKQTNDGDELRHLLDHDLFISRGDYLTNIPRWESVFDPSQILYIPFGLIKNDPIRVMRDVENHLMIPEFKKYSKLKDPIFPTNKIGKVISSDIIDRMKEITEPQYAFLSERFGDDFLKNTK